jgi:hypothetical protein
MRKQIAMRKFAEIDTNKDGQIDRVELSAYALKQFGEMDLNKDRFISEEEFKKAQEAEAAKIRAIVADDDAGPAAGTAPAGPAPTAWWPARSGALGPAARPAAGYALGVLTSHDHDGHLSRRSARSARASSRRRHSPRRGCRRFP